MIKRLFCCFKNTKSDKNNIINNVDINVDINSISNIDIIINTSDKPILYKDTIKFIPPIEKGTVIKVYDGDTITIASKLPYPESPLYRFQVRLNGIDCPEIKSKNNSEKECSLISKQVLSSLILDKVVTLKNIQTEKYGRILADVYLDNLNLNKYMLDKRLAVVYDGGTKISPKDWIDYYYKGEM